MVYAIDTAASDCDEENWNPALTIDSSTGVVSGTLLSTALSACSLELTASANSITINKTITVAITQQAPIAEVTTVSVSNPASNPGAETNPTIDLSPLTIGDTIVIL